MCETKSERGVMVCDVSIRRVRQELDANLPGRVRYTHVDGEGTLVEVDATVDAARFQQLIQAAIAAAQNATGAMSCV